MYQQFSSLNQTTGTKLYCPAFTFPGSRTPLPGFYFSYNIWQDAGIRTRVAETAARCATIELHTSLSCIYKCCLRRCFLIPWV